MKIEYPCIEINLSKIAHNTRIINSVCNSKGIHLVGVTKVFCARRPIVQAMLEGELEIVGDSRIENLKRLQGMKCRKMLLRIPMESHAADVVKYSDISLNSELETIRLLSKTAKRLKRLHNIILMVDVGDLREGMLEEDVIEAVKEIMNMTNVRLCGIGTNLTCYGGVIPDINNLGKLTRLKKYIYETLNFDVPILSGGNSSTLYMVLNGTIPEGINQLRIGEAILLGRETSFGGEIPNCHKDIFIIKGEIVEIKEKPSVPIGRIGTDAFGKKPVFEDKGTIKRAIIAIGRQDIVPEGLEPIDKNITVLGASSDHLILNITNCTFVYKLGDIIDFYMDYGCLLRAMTSPYVKKYYMG